MLQTLQTKCSWLLFRQTKFSVKILQWLYSLYNGYITYTIAILIMHMLYVNSYCMM